MNSWENDVPCSGYDCECTQCTIALLEFYQLYLKCCERFSDAECANATQSQYRVVRQARRVLSAFSRQLIGQSSVGHVDLRKVLQLVNRCGFCQEMVDKWNAAADSANLK